MTTASEGRDPAALLRLIWLASPALPVGGFSYSEGLEAAVEAGLAGDEARAGDWLLQQLQLVVARAEAPLLVQAVRAWRTGDAGDGARIAALNAWVRQTRETAEGRLQTEQMGRSLLEWLKNGEQAADPRVGRLAALGDEGGAPTWPVAYALATVLAGADEADAAVAFVFSWCENMTQAAMKAVPLGQAAAQRMLARLAAAVPDVVQRALALPDGERQAFAPLLAVLGARHEVQYSRLFRS